MMLDNFYTSLWYFSLCKGMSRLTVSMAFDRSLTIPNVNLFSLKLLKID